MKHSDQDTLFFRNVLGSSLGELFWGIGLPIVVESTFLQLFLRNLGAPSTVVGLVPTLFFVGMSLFGLLAGYLTSHLENKRTVILITHTYGSIPLFIFGIVLTAGGYTDSTLTLFLVCYSLFSLGIGLILPIWQNYLMKLFSERKVFSALAVIMFTQTIARLITSFIVLGTVKRYSMDSRAAGLIFISVGGVFLIGTFMYLITREAEGTGEAGVRHSNFFAHLYRSGRRIIRNRGFIFYLLSDIETYAVITVISFYANYAVGYCGISDAAAAGLFIALYYSAQVCVHLVLGWFDLLDLKRKFVLSKITSMLGIGLIIVFQSVPAFLLVSFLLGISRAVRHLAFPPAVKRISGLKDATNYFSLAPIMVLPFSAGLPVFSGMFLDAAEGMGGASYRIVFGGMLFLVIVSTIFLSRIDFQSAPDQKPRSIRIVS
ncbi:MAG: MFS transporter [Spirochaetia bacterium]